MIVKMAITWFIILAAACTNAYLIEPIAPWTRNTIFADEKLEGQIFENLKEFDVLDATRRTSDNSRAYRLPTTTKPIHYDILWAIDIDKLTFSGAVTIELHATRRGVKEIIIHASEINLNSTQLYLNNMTIKTSVVEEIDIQFLRIKLLNTTLQYSKINPIIYTLTIYFSAPLRTDMNGIYRSWYRNKATDEDIKWMAASQFEATAARWAFPCYDEPSFKATFDITIRRPTDYKSWSCTRIAMNRPANVGYEDDIYYRTPVMSTFLLALIVADYESREHFENDCPMYEVIARPGAISEGQGDYAFDVGMELLGAMSDHTGIDFYSFNDNLKITHAAIPDMRPIAMQNWGLITYRETYLMYDKEHTNSFFKQYLAGTVSHEISHMWFGNLVTCDWWNVVWLHEAFARYYEYFLTHSIEEYMGMETRFITEQVHNSLQSDSANNPNPLSTTSVGNHDSVKAMFSTITYSKGASIVRQTEHLLGFDVHRQGLRNYLSLKAFDTARPIDLFKCLQNASVTYNAISEYGPSFSVIDYYKSWTEQAGHPILSVRVNHKNGEMTIYQRRFNINTGYSSINTNYIIPITFATASSPDFGNTKPTHIIRKALTTIQRGSIGDEWVVFNKQQTGFYRVNYDDYTWDLIIAALRTNRTQIHEYNRAQIVNDVFQFARSSLMSYTRAFGILSFLEYETEYAPWDAALAVFSWMRNRFSGTRYLYLLDRLIMRWSNTSITQLTYLPLPNESFMTSYLRYKLAPTLCAINAPSCRESAVTQLAALRDNNIEVPVDSRSWVYCNALRQGTQADFNFLWNRFNTHHVYSEKTLLLMVLGCTPFTDTLNMFLKAIVTPKVLHLKESITAWDSAVSGNERNTQIVFRFVRKNLQAVIDAFGSASTPLSYISARLRSIEEIDAFQDWAKLNKKILWDQYDAIYEGAESSRESLKWAHEVRDDFMNYYKMSGILAVTRTEPGINIVSGDLEEIVSPDLIKRSSAASTYVSMFVLAITFIANFI